MPYKIYINPLIFESRLFWPLHTLSLWELLGYSLIKQVTFILMDLCALWRISQQTTWSACLGWITADSGWHSSRYLFIHLAISRITSIGVLISWTIIHLPIFTISLFGLMVIRGNFKSWIEILASNYIWNWIDYIFSILPSQLEKKVWSWCQLIF